MDTKSVQVLCIRSFTGWRNVVKVASVNVIELFAEMCACTCLTAISAPRNLTFKPSLAAAKLICASGPEPLVNKKS
jgi:hypothetical protein